MNPGEHLGGFELLEELGRGGMGVVFRARELSLDREVALKVLLPGLSAEGEYVERFRREARIIAALRHPNIVNVLSYGEVDGRPYFAMEYVAGRDLGRLLKERGPLPPAEALAIAAQVASGLEEASARGITHRDIKPSNIIIDDGGRALISDFGIARLVAQEGLTRTNSFLGTPEYASPELANGGEVDVRSDIYSLGAVLYRALTGEPPVSGGSPLAIMVRIASEGAAPVAEANPALPAPVCALVDGMLALDPARRPQTAGELLAAIRDCDARLARDDAARLEPTVLVAAKRPEPGRRSSRGIRVASLGVALAAVLLVAWMALPGPHAPPVAASVEPSDPWPEPPSVAAAPLTRLPPAPPERQAPRDEAAPRSAALAPGGPVVSPPPLPARPAVMVVVFGDELMVPLVRSHLSETLLEGELDLIAAAPIPEPQRFGPMGRPRWSPSEITRLVPPGRAQILVLARIQRTGSTPLYYAGRVDEMTLASFSVQTIDVATGSSIHSGSAGSIQFTALNMDRNLQNAIAPVAESVREGIEKYWRRKRTEAGTSGHG